MLNLVFKRLFKRGQVTVIWPDGTSHHYGDGTGDQIIMALHGRNFPLQLALNPKLALGEGYMRGNVEMRQGTIADFLEAVTSNLGASGSIPMQGAFDAFMRASAPLRQMNRARRAQANVQHHYDLDDRLYDLFLDDDKQYSCAYFEHPDMSLADAQRAKKHLIARKLYLQPNQSVLDIGCGWGGTALTLARDYGVQVLGITLSENQLAVARARAQAAGLADQVRFELIDYRTLQGQRFDRIVSVGMFEHVGQPNYGTYFQTIHDLLADDGVALVHSIGRMDGPGETPAFIRKYIFPGGYVPALSQVVPVIERADLWITDVEILRLHYAETLRHWRQRFVARWADAAALYDDEFCRMWEFYLAASEMTFRHWGQMVFQIQLTKQVDALPVCRSYMCK